VERVGQLKGIFLEDSGSGFYTTFSRPLPGQQDTPMEVVDRIKQHLSSQPVVLFMKGTPDFPQCGFSAQSVAALRHVGANFHAVNIFEDLELRDELKRYSNWPTYPQLYVNGELIGGCDITMQMLQNGELQQLLDEAGATKA
jgi:monothiol glutaredoxin